MFQVLQLKAFGNNESISSLRKDQLLTGYQQEGKGPLDHGEMQEETIYFTYVTLKVASVSQLSLSLHTMFLQIGIRFEKMPATKNPLSVIER